MISTAPRLVNLEDLHQAMREGRDLLYPSQPKIMVGTATCGLAAGAESVLLDNMTPEAARRCVELGCRMLSLGIDVWFFQRGLQAFAADFAEFFGEPGA